MVVRRSVLGSHDPLEAPRPAASMTGTIEKAGSKAAEPDSPRLFLGMRHFKGAVHHRNSDGILEALFQEKLMSGYT